MKKIIFSIHGNSPIEAFDDLSGLNVVALLKHNVENENREALTLSILASIIGIVGGAITAAEQIKQWYKESKKGGKIDKIVVIVDGKKILFEDISTSELVEILKKVKTDE